MMRNQRNQGRQRRPEVRVHLRCSANNTHVTVTTGGRTWGSASGGEVRLPNGKRLEGARRARPSAAEAAAALARRRARARGLRRVRGVHVHFQGKGSGRRAALSGLRAQGVRVLSLSDRTPRPHGGCRPKKARRV